MPASVITSVDQLTPEWLNATLRASGALVSGSVSEVQADAGTSNWATNARLRLQYSADATGDCPASLFVKMVKIAEDDDESFSDSEVTYYTRDYVDVPDAPLVRCHGGAFSAELGRYHLVLDDVGATHIEATGRPPTLDYALALADGFAALHARWWNADLRSKAGHPMHDAAHLQRFVDISAPGIPHVLEHRFDALVAPFDEPATRHWPDLLQQIATRYAGALIERTQDANGFTLIHGDPGCTNILVPREGGRPIYLIDRQPFDWSLTTWLGVYDLVYAAVLDWPIEDRRRLERPMLERYHQQLLARGVTGYDFDQLWTDYRLSIPLGALVAAEYNRGGLLTDLEFVWLPYLQRVLTACDDLACAELW